MFGLVSTWQIRLAEYLIVIVVLCGVAYGIYHKGGEDRAASIATEQAKADNAQREKYDKISSDYEELKNKRQQNVNTITKEITHIIDKPVYNVQCIDDSGRMLINDALAGRAYTKQPDTAVQAAPKP